VAKQKNRGYHGNGSLYASLSEHEAFLLGEAVVCATFIINYTPTHVVSRMTPYEHLHGKKPSISHFKIF
jgi:hypothetical protein